MRRYRSVRLGALLAGPPRADMAVRLPPVDATVPSRPMRVGAATLALFGVRDDWPPGGVLPPFGCQVHTISDATVHSSAGIVGLRTGEVLTDTLDHTAPGLDGYALDGADVLLPGAGATLPGRYLSLLLGNHANHFHWLVMNFARLALLQPHELAGLAGVLVPAGLQPPQVEALRLARLAEHAPLRPVAAGETLRVETLVLPWNVASGDGANPAIGSFLRGLLPGLGAGERRIYVDRRGAALRRLANEDEVVAALAREGVEPVRMEWYGLEAQARLIAEAALVVGPHGAGLSNIAFCRPGARIVELMPAERLNWCYRHLAAACRHEYDCVFGRSLAGGAWVVSPTHVLSAIGA